MCAPRRPRIVIMLYIHPEASTELGVELRLDRPHRDVLVVGGAVYAVEMRCTVEDVVAPMIAPCAGVHHAVVGGHHRRRPVDHRDIEHLTLTGRAVVPGTAEQYGRRR